ncbi:DNA polymerase IV [Acuticoccus mangrovi]|uniref:DNA polymerase IV n=1 Tax=Acuticoccus mangrovi TaxID=2796142 RepID=A0A934IJI8_9HYPH|nr:DNA polymerase IV [Acuticoccus mangrovi]
MSPTLCRDCATLLVAPLPARGRCPRCNSPRLVSHPELARLTIAHVDCDAFFAAVEKRDDPSLADVPLIVGGGRRGVVSTCCYLARIHGVRSAMPMFKALKLCPDAVVLRPNFEKYVTVGREVRERMRALTPLVQPLSIDEAFLDLAGTERLHGAPPAVVMARFAKAVETEVGITVSVGLAPNKFLAKFASDAEKPRGFTVIGSGDAEARLADEPVTQLPGVGPAAASRLAKAGITHVRQLQRAEEVELMRRFGETGQRLKRLAHGRDDRAVDPASERKSVSAETTFEEDIADRAELLALLRHLSEKVSTRLKAADIAGRTVTLKLKTPDFRTHTRALSLPAPTAMAHRIFAAGKALLAGEADGRRFRLIGIGVSHLVPIATADAEELFDPARGRLGKAEKAMDALRARFGNDAVIYGQTLSDPRRRSGTPPRRTGE